MKRLHVHVSVDELAPSVAFYSALFGAEPLVSRPDYAKWLLDDPRVNFAISRKDDNQTGLNHLGVQVETVGELDEVYERLGRANIASQPETCARCCYAEADKHWGWTPPASCGRLTARWEPSRSMAMIAARTSRACSPNRRPGSRPRSPAAPHDSARARSRARRIRRDPGRHIPPARAAQPVRAGLFADAGWPGGRRLPGSLCVGRVLARR